MKKTAAIKLIIATPVFMVLANFLVVFAQEYAHAITAGMLSHKGHSLTIYFSCKSLMNLPLLFHINAHVNYDLMTSAKHMRDLAVIGFAGLGLANGGMYLLTFSLLKRKLIQRLHLVYYFLFWLNFMSIAQIFSYIPVRTFSDHGDAANIAHGLHISPWLICIFGGYAVTFMIWHFFTRTLTCTYDVLQLKSNRVKAILMMLCAIPLFGYFGVTGFIDNSDVAHFLSAASLFLLPGVIAACWPLSQRKSLQHITTVEQIEKIAETITETIAEKMTKTFHRQEPTITEELALPHVSIDEAHFIENMNAALDQRDAKIRESQKIIKNKLAKTPK